MKNKRIGLTISLLLGWALIQGQDVSPTREHHIVLETGLVLPNANLYDDIAIRQNPLSDSWSSYNDGTVTFSSVGFMLGARWKWCNTTSGLGISLGIRTKGIFNDITGNSAKNGDYFYLRYYTDDFNKITKFARIKTIDETLFILTLPVELQYTILRREFFDAFISLGTEIGYVAIRNMEFTFRDDAMKAYEGDVRNAVHHQSNDFYGATYGSFGVVVGSSRNIMFEICAPGIYFNKKYFDLGTASFFTTLKFSLQIPILKNN